MPCYHPLDAYQLKEINPLTGKRIICIVGKNEQGYEHADYIKLPCGKCLGCKLERSRQWAVRCVHESKMWKDNCFITLTFNDMFIPGDNSLHVEYFQKFMKRLRKKFGGGVRYFMCGEYGELLQRPHFHACLFNFDFKDKVLWSMRGGVRLYRSADLEQLWTCPITGLSYGFTTVGDVTFDSAAYVARYCVKKISGDGADDHYGDLKPEFTTMSRRPGIAYSWFKKWYKTDCFPQDFVVMNGMECKPPRYYDKIYDLTDKVDMDRIRENRRLAAISNVDNSYSRLYEREVVAKANAARLRRSYETGRV